MKKITLLSLTLLSIVGLSACSTDNISNSTKKTAESSQTSSPAADFKVGDTLTFDKEAEITVTGVDFTEERNQFANSNPDRVMQVTYNVKNLSNNDLVLGSDIELYVNGKKMETYPNEMTVDTISSGRSYEGAKINFAVTESGDMELEVKPSFSFTSKAKIIKLEQK